MVVWFENSSGTHERCLQNGKILHWYSIWKYINIDQNAEKFSTNPNDWIANKTTTIYRIARRVVAHFVTLFLSFSLSFCFLPLLFHTKHCSEYVCCVFSTISLWSVKRANMLAIAIQTKKNNTLSFTATVLFLISNCHILLYKS